jgi:hypothetical protein
VGVEVALMLCVNGRRERRVTAGALVERMKGLDGITSGTVGSRSDTRPFRANTALKLSSDRSSVRR